MASTSPRRTASLAQVASAGAIDSTLWMRWGSKGDQRVGRVVIGSHDGRKGWINRLAVSPGYRRHGIGAALVDAVIELARRNGHATLLVRSNVVREGAHDFYPALGFTHHKTSHTYVMTLE